MPTNLNQLVPKKLSQDIFLNRVEKDYRHIMAAFNKQAKRDGWTEEERRKVAAQTQSADDLDGVVQVIMVYCP